MRLWDFCWSKFSDDTDSIPVLELILKSPLLPSIILNSKLHTRKKMQKHMITECTVIIILVCACTKCEGHSQDGKLNIMLIHCN